MLAILFNIEEFLERNVLIGSGYSVVLQEVIVLYDNRNSYSKLPLFSCSSTVDVRREGDATHGSAESGRCETILLFIFVTFSE